ncbi:hypothetical protein F5B17DRAFT_318317 [Nemania serpens]|nr:hypothetical protein F5B17DRAFT_318317 [Nemania serpens]
MPLSMPMTATMASRPGVSRLAATSFRLQSRSQSQSQSTRPPPGVLPAAQPGAGTPARSRAPLITKTPVPPPQPLPLTRWTSAVRARVGKCIMFGCDAAQIRRASAILATLASEWRELTVGSEGFLTGGRRGLEDQQVVWGEMDSFATGNVHDPS